MLKGIKKDWNEQLVYYLWAYRTSIRSNILCTSYKYEVFLPLEVDITPLRVSLEGTSNE